MTMEQLTEQMLRQNREIAGIAASLKSAHKRIDENDRITEGIYKLAANVESLALQVKLLTESVDSRIERLENSQKTQGERIGTLEREPARKWRTLMTQVGALITAALVGGGLSHFLS